MQEKSTHARGTCRSFVAHGEGELAFVADRCKTLTIHDHQDIIMAINHNQGRNNHILAPNDQLQLRGDVLQGDVDEGIGELHSRVKTLKGVALAIETEGKFENELLT